MECASRSCAVLADGDDSVLILDSNGFLAPSTIDKFWTIGKPARIFTDNAFSVSLAKFNKTYHVFYTTVADNAVKLHHLKSEDRKFWKTASAPAMTIEPNSRLCTITTGNGIVLTGTQVMESGRKAIIFSTLNLEQAWSQPQPLVSGDNISGNFDVIATSNGNIHCVYEVTSQEGKPIIRSVTRQAN
jgi:hypothetical protein